METHKAFATCASQYSWNTVIENHSNAKKICSRHRIQAWTSVSCFDHSCTELLGNLGSPLTFMRTWIYALLISNQRTAGTLTFVKTMAVFLHCLSCFTLYCHICLCISNVALRGQCKKLKHGTFARLNPRHVRGLKPTGIMYLLWESSFAAESWCLRYKYQARSWGIL